MSCQQLGLHLVIDKLLKLELWQQSILFVSEMDCIALLVRFIISETVFTFWKLLIICVEEIDQFHYLKNLQKPNSLILNVLII